MNEYMGGIRDGWMDAWVDIFREEYRWMCGCMQAWET